MKEEYKQIIGYENLYLISNTGKIKSIKRGKVLKPNVLLDGHLQVTLYNNNTRKVKSIHRLVAEHFIPNPNNLPLINHKDENPLNNIVDNLEWCDYKYNSNYGNSQIKRIKSKQIKVNQYDLKGNLITSFDSIIEIQKIFPSGYKLWDIRSVYSKTNRNHYQSIKKLNNFSSC